MNDIERYTRWLEDEGIDKYIIEDDAVIAFMTKLVKPYELTFTIERDAKSIIFSMHIMDQKNEPFLIRKRVKKAMAYMLEENDTNLFGRWCLDPKDGLARFDIVIPLYEIDQDTFRSLLRIIVGYGSKSALELINIVNKHPTITLTKINKVRMS